MRRKFNKNIFLFFILAAPVLVFGTPAYASSIKNNVSATANSGGNKLEGSGTIETGDANAKSSVSTKINGEEDTIEIRTEVKARANGQEVEIKTEGDESVSIEKEIGGAKAEVDITADRDADMDAEIGADETEKVGVVEKIWEGIKSFFGNIF